jgi:hypothetical protein
MAHITTNLQYYINLEVVECEQALEVWGCGTRWGCRQLVIRRVSCRSDVRSSDNKTPLRTACRQEGTALSYGLGAGMLAG